MPSLTLPSMALAVRSRFGRTSLRERGLLASLAVAGLVALPFAVQGWAQAEVDRASADAARLQSLSSPGDMVRLWRSASELAGLEARVQAWTPTAPSFPVARVLAEQALVSAAVQAGLLMPDVQAAETPDRIGAVTFVRLEVSADFGWAKLAALTRRLNSTCPGCVIERAAAEGEGAEARLRMVVLSPFRVTGRG